NVTGVQTCPLPIFSPVMSLPISEVKSTSSTGALVESFSSCPAIVSKIKALSFTFRVIGPIWSNEDANATKPKRDTRPYVGFIPTTPQYDAGWRIEPPVSEPNENGTKLAATAAAEPPEEPPGTAL